MTVPYQGRRQQDRSPDTVDAEADGAIVSSGASCRDRFWGFRRPGMGQLEDS